MGQTGPVPAPLRRRRPRRRPRCAPAGLATLLVVGLLAGCSNGGASAGANWTPQPGYTLEPNPVNPNAAAEQHAQPVLALDHGIAEWAGPVGVALVHG